MFNTRLIVDVPEDVSLWDAVQHLAVYIHDLLSKRPGRVAGIEYQLVDTEWSRIKRASVAELQSAATEHHLKVDHIIAGSTLYPDARNYTPVLKVMVWGRLPGGMSPKGVDISFEATDKVLMDGVRAQIDHEAQNLRSGPLLVPVPTAVVAAPAHPPVGDPVTPTPQMASSDSEDTRGWVARTWRDHTATFLVTVVGGVFAVAIALWLGLTK